MRRRTRSPAAMTRGLRTRVCVAASPSVADALARFAAVVDEEGARVLPEDVRATVAARLDTWRADDVAIGRHWIAPLVAPLAEAHRPLAQLALLVAMAPHQVDAD